MSRDHTLLNLILDWIDIVNKARWAKSDPEKRQKVFRFGICAVIYALMTAVFSCGLLLFQFVGNGIIVSVLALIFGITIGVFCTLVCLVTALIYWFCQLSVNKKPITWISLVLMLAGFAAAVMIPFIFLAA